MSKTKQVLLVDDDPDYMYLVEEALSTCQPPCMLKTFSNGVDLVNYLESNRRPNVIFLDINMPGSNGFEVLKQLRATDRYKAIPVVMLTVSERREDIQKSYQTGANAYIVKPMTFDQLKKHMDLFSHYWFDVAQTPGPSWLRPDGYSSYN